MSAETHNKPIQTKSEAVNVLQVHNNQRVHVHGSADTEIHDPTTVRWKIWRAARCLSFRCAISIFNMFVFQLTQSYCLST